MERRYVPSCQHDNGYYYDNEYYDNEYYNEPFPRVDSEIIRKGTQLHQNTSRKQLSIFYLQHQNHTVF
jgi:hypothetical protein